MSNINLVFLTPSTTSIVQPLDQGIILSLKYRKFFLGEVFDMNIKKSCKKLKEFNLLHCVENVSSAWSCVASRPGEGSCDLGDSRDQGYDNDANMKGKKGLQARILNENPRAFLCLADVIKLTY